MKFLMLVVLSLFVIGFSAFKSPACIQIAGRESVGIRINIDGLSAARFMRYFTNHLNRAYWQKVRVELQKDKRKFVVFEIRNNLAVSLLHLGRVKEAIAILEGLEKTNPGEYIVAANLGTAYELNGEDAKALEWIKEGVIRAPNSHFGTEWLHIKILETKLALARDPEWLKTRTVLGVDFGSSEQRMTSEIFATDHLNQRKTLKDIEEALVYQLHERMEFIKPPEPVVENLLSDLSRVFAISRTPKHAQAIKSLVVKYSAASKDVQKKR